MRIACSLALLVALLGAEEPPAVALVNGRPVTLKQVEDSLLAKEGKEAIQKWVDANLERIAWDRLRDEDPILAIGFNKLSRKELAAVLVAQGAGPVREDLINIRVVEDALAAARVVITPVQVRATWERMATKFQAEMAAKGNTGVDLANWIRTREGLSLEEYQAQPGFQMLAGLQALVHARALTEFSDDQLRAAFAGRPERYRVLEAVDLSLISIPYRGVQPGQTVPVEERQRLAQVGDSLHRQIASGQVPFGRTWEAFGKAWDAGAGAEGRIGWIPQDGRRLDGPPVSDEVVRAAWQVTRFPALLPPLLDSRGVSLAVVHGHRPQRDPSFEEVRDRVRADLIDATLEQRTAALLRELRTSATVEYRSLPGAVEQR